MTLTSWLVRSRDSCIACAHVAAQLRFEFHGNDVDDDYVIAGQEPVKALRSIVKCIKKEVGVKLALDTSTA